MMQLLQRNDGYVAMTSAIIIMVLMLAIVVALTLAAFLNSSGISTSYYKETSLALARACADTALLKLVQNSTYGGNETLSIGADACAIAPVTLNGNQKIISTSAKFQRTVTKLKVTVNAANLAIVSWEEE